MASIRTTNKNLLAGAMDRQKQLAAVRNQAVARMSDPAYASPGQQAQLNSVIANIDHQTAVLAKEMAHRKALENAYAAASTQKPPPANPDADPGVKKAQDALHKHRAEHKSDYPKGQLTTGCVSCVKKDLGKVQPWVGRTSPAVLAKLNQDMGTSIDFNALAGFEGGQWRKTYIPCSKGTVAGASGVTIATGFDVGQVSPASIDGMEIPAATKAKLKKFAGKSYKGQSCADADAAMNKLGAETFTQEEADAIDYAVKKKHLGPAKADWDATIPSGKPKFTSLTPAQQTVIFSRTYHQGTGMPKTAVAKEFYKAAQNGDWITAEQKLRTYNVSQSWYKNRVNAEADLLAKERHSAGR